MVNVQKEDKELISYARRLRKIQDRIEQLNEILRNLSKHQNSIKNQIDKKEEEIKKINRLKQSSKNITIISSALSIIISGISGALSLTGYSQEGGILSLFGSATSGFFALIGSIVDNHFSIRETDVQNSKAELEKKLEIKLGEKFSRDRRSLRESWIELVDIYEDLYLLRHTSKNFPKEVDKALFNFLDALSKINQEKDNEKYEKLEKEEVALAISPIRIQTASFFGRLSVKRSKEYIVPLPPPPPLPPFTPVKPINISRALPEQSEQPSSAPHDIEKTKERILNDEDLPKKWKENDNDIAKKIEELIEKINDYRQKLINQSYRYQ